MDRTQLVAINPGQSEPESDSNEGVLRSPKISSITGTPPLDCLVSYTGHSLWRRGSYPSAEKQSVYFTAQTDWSNFVITTDLGEGKF